MHKRIPTILLALAALVMLAVAPAGAQFDDDVGENVLYGSIVEILQDEDLVTDYSMFLNALEAAEGDLLERFADENQRYTVFAPYDAAFVATLQALDMTEEELLADPQLLDNILAYHVIPGVFDSQYFLALLDLNLAEVPVIGTVLPENYLTIDGGTGTAIMELDSVASVTEEYSAANGYVYAIDAVLLPPELTDVVFPEAAGDSPLDNLTDSLESMSGEGDASFTTLLDLIGMAEPGILDTLNATGPYTVFAPTDAAIEQTLQENGLTLEDIAGDSIALTEILGFHIVPGHFSAQTLLEEAENVAYAFSPATAISSYLAVQAVDGELRINEVASVTRADIEANNGVIHVIDRLLLPQLRPDFSSAEIDEITSPGEQ